MHNPIPILEILHLSPEDIEDIFLIFIYMWITRPNYKFWW